MADNNSEEWGQGPTKAIAWTVAAIIFAIITTVAFVQGDENFGWFFLIVALIFSRFAYSNWRTYLQARQNQRGANADAVVAQTGKVVGIIIFAALLIFFFVTMGKSCSVIFSDSHIPCEYRGCHEEATIKRPDGFWACDRHKKSTIYKAWE